MNILITGGASGLGAAITKKLADDHTHTVYFTYFKSTEHAKQMSRVFPNIQSVYCDFQNLDEVEALAAKIVEMDLDVLINNAITGITINHFNKLPLQTFHIGFMNNLLPTIRIAQQAILTFRKKKSGKIITILSSLMKKSPLVGLSCYLAEKAYLESLTRSWAIENRKFNITSISIFPSFMETNLTRNIDERIIEEIRNERSTKRLLRPEEVADTVNALLLAKDEFGEDRNYKEMVLR